MFFIFLVGLSRFNRFELYPSSTELRLINETFNIEIDNVNDLDVLITKIKMTMKEDDRFDGQISFDAPEKFRYGSCYNRSLLIQKILLYNEIDFYPVYVFYELSGTTSLFSVFRRSISSHQSLVVYFGENYYFVEVNNSNSGITVRNLYDSWDDYKQNSVLREYDIRFIPYLNNRHGRYIWPNFLPDFYL